jgi:hypothetical protein
MHNRAELNPRRPAELLRLALIRLLDRYYQRPGTQLNLFR